MPSIITIDRSVVKADEMATVRFSFTNNESITLLGSRGFPHITVTGGTLENVTQPLGLVDGYYVYTIRFIPTRNLEQSDCRITYRNPNSPAADGQSAAFSVDTLRPTVASASIAQSDLRSGEKTTITITFSELVLRNTFTLDDLQVGAGKGTLSNLRVAPSDATATTTAATTWLVDLEAPATLPATGLDGNQIRINLDGITDRVGNAGPRGRWNWETRTDSPTYLPTVSYNIDAPPTVAITGQPATTLKSGESFTVTFTFSERVTGFGTEDIQYDTSKGTLGALTAVGTDGRVWTATYTPSSDIESAKNTISVNLAGVLDAQGNIGAGSGSSGNFSIDTKPPEVTVTISDERLTAGETATVTFTFRESVTGFGTEDIQYDTSKDYYNGCIIV